MKWIWNMVIRVCVYARIELRLDHQTRPERTSNVANDNKGLQYHCTGNNKMASMGAITELLEWCSGSFSLEYYLWLPTASWTPLRWPSLVRRSLKNAEMLFFICGRNEGTSVHINMEFYQERPRLQLQGPFWKVHFYYAPLPLVMTLWPYSLPQ